MNARRRVAFVLLAAAALVERDRRQTNERIWRELEVFAESFGREIRMSCEAYEAGVAVGRRRWWRR